MKKIFIIASTLMILGTTAAFAQEQTTTRSDKITKAQEARAIAQDKRDQAKQRLDQKRAELEQKKAELKAAAVAKKDESCQKRLDRLDNRVANADKRKKGLLTHYQKAAEHLQRLIDRGTAAGVDVTELTADLVEYNTMVDGLATDFDAFVEVVTQAQTAECPQSKEQLRALHQQIKAAHQKVVSDRKAIHNYYKNTVRPDVKATVKAIAATKSSDDTTTNSGEAQ